MLKAALLTIGTEITSGEIVNANAAWISLQLEGRGARVFRHLTVRDDREEIAAALTSLSEFPLNIVTGGLGPTSDDITRECVARAAGVKLEFDDEVWDALRALHERRGLAVREAHKHQCWFPSGSKRLANPVGSALGFSIKVGQSQLFVLPGPPRELEGMWKMAVEPALAPISGTNRWVRWTCLGAPESEVAEVVERVIQGRGIEVGYRAQVPYVKVKIFVDPVRDSGVVQALDAALKPWLVARGDDDLAKQLMSIWPEPDFHLVDTASGDLLVQRLHAARGEVHLKFQNFGALAGAGLAVHVTDDQTFNWNIHVAGKRASGEMKLPYKLTVTSERGRRSIVEWAVWETIKFIRGMGKL